jgi:hypothetical protein
MYKSFMFTNRRIPAKIYVETIIKKIRNKKQTYEHIYL